MVRHCSLFQIGAHEAFSRGPSSTQTDSGHYFPRSRHSPLPHRDPVSGHSSCFTWNVSLAVGADLTTDNARQVFHVKHEHLPSPSARLRDLMA